MAYIYLQPYDGCDNEILDEIARRLMDTLPVPVRVLPSIESPVYAFDPDRKQYYSTKILRYIVNSHSDSALRTIGITAVDLFIPILTYVFGEAQLDGKAAIVSGARLKQEYYGLKPDKRLYVERLFKELMHELGHTFGLTHCDLSYCVMHLSNNVIGIDKKTAAFCENHKDQLINKLKELEIPYGK
ncbi:MAG: archaemetzincin family Zn-dependent metalloprotease [Deltaproteobacteria bacterium]|nr:archaemetzincin family Zn-dependent metalloprotease [Deltaproteobacteria bacterium]